MKQSFNVNAQNGNKVIVLPFIFTVSKLDFFQLTEYFNADLHYCNHWPKWSQKRSEANHRDASQHKTILKAAAKMESIDEAAEG